MKNRHYFFSFLIVIILLVIILFSFKNYSNFESTDNAYVRGSITTISSRIEGYVVEVPGVLNKEVKKDDINWIVKTNNGKIFSTPNVIIAGGVGSFEPRKFPVKELSLIHI